MAGGAAGNVGVQGNRFPDGFAPASALAGHAMMARTHRLAALCIVAALIAAGVAVTGCALGPAQQFRELSCVPVPYGRPYAATVCGKNAYVANGPGGLVIVDIAAAERPRVLGSYVTGNLGRESIGREWIHEYRGVATSVSVAPGGRVVYVLTQSKGYDVGRSKIIRLDVSDPAKPRFAGEYLLHSSANHVAAVDAFNVAVTRNLGGPSFPSNRKSVFSVVNFREPGRSCIVGNLDVGTAGKGLGAVAVHERTAVVAAAEGGKGRLLVVDLADTASPKLIARLPLAAPPRDLAMTDDGRTAYVAWQGAARMTVVDVSDRAQPKATGEAACPADGPLPRPFPSASAAVSVSIEPGLGLVVHRAGNEPVWVPLVGEARRLHMEGDVLTITIGPDFRWNGRGLEPLGDAAPPPLPWPSSPEDLKLQPTERLSFRAAVVQNDVAYVATGRDGLRTFDVRVRANPKPLGRFYNRKIGRHCIVDVVVAGRIGYAADLDNGVFVLDVSEPASPKELAHFHQSNARSLHLSGNLLTVACGVYGLVVLDVSGPARPLAVARYHAPDVKFNDAVLVHRQGAMPLVHVADAGCVRSFELDLSVPPMDYFPPRLAAHVKLPMGIPDMVRVSDDGRHAYMVNDEGWNFITFDLADLSNPRVASVAATSGFAHGFALRGNVAFVCNNFDTVTFFDVSDAAAPKVLGWVVTGPRSCHCEVLGDALFVWTKGGICCVDVADLSKPQIKGTYQHLGTGFQAVEEGGRRYLLGSGPGGWQKVDVTDLSSPKRAALLAGEGYGATTAHGELALVARGDQMVVIRWTGQPQVVGTLKCPAPVSRIGVRGQHAYLAGPILAAADISNPAEPKLLGQVRAQPNEGTYGGGGGRFFNAEPFVREGRDCVAVSDHYWGLRIFDVSDKHNLSEVGDFATSGGDFTGIDASRDRVYVGNNWGGIYIVDASDPGAPRLVGSTRRLTSPNKGSAGLLAVGDLLYFQGNTDRVMRVADVSEPAHPKLLGESAVPKEGQTGDNRRFGSTFPQLRGNLLYTPGFARIYDVSNPAAFRLVGESKEVGFTSDSCVLADIDGKAHLVITSSWGLRVVDVSDATRPRLVGIAPGDYQGGYYFGRGICVRGTLAYVCDRHQLNIVDLSDPARPRRVGSIEVSGFTCDVQLAGDLAYVVSYFDGVHVIDVSDPARPRPVDHFQQGVYWDAAGWDNLACYQCIKIAGSYAYVTDYYSGLLVIQIGE